MIKNLDELSINEKLDYVKVGAEYASFVACRDYKDYNQYRQNTSEAVTNTSMKVLSLLDSLGYPMDELGTYLYKELIENIIIRLRNVSRRDDVRKLKTYLLSLKNEYSETYHSIARNDLEIGIRSFHEYIRRAISKIDYRRCNKELMQSIYSKTGYDLSHGEQAFLFASYILGKLKTNENNKSNITSNIRSLSK